MEIISVPPGGPACRREAIECRKERESDLDSRQLSDRRETQVRQKA